MFWQHNKPVQPKRTLQPSKYVYIPGSQPNRETSGVDSSSDRQRPPNEGWKEEGDDDSGLEDGAQPNSLQQEARERDTLTSTAAFSKAPALKGTTRVVRKGSAASKVGMEKSTSQPGKKSVWERLGGKVGETSQKVHSRT